MSDVTQTGGAAPATNTNDAGAGAGTSQSQTPPQGTSGQGGQWYPDSYKDFVQTKGYKSVDDVFKQASEADKKITELGEKVSQSEKFENQVAPILQIIWSDPELLKTVRAKLSGEQPQQPQKPSDQNTDKTQAPSQQQQAPQGDPAARRVLEKQIFASFEQEHGFDKLDKETLADLRKRIGKQLQWYFERGGVDIEQLPTILKKAFRDAKEEDSAVAKIVSGIPNTQTPGSMPSISGGAVSSEGDIQLTPEQAKVAERMGGVEAYKKGLKKLQTKK